MERAVLEAQRGAERGEVPIGAVLVIGGEILACAHNSPISLSDPTAHAEVLALRDAARATGNYRLPGSTLYVTVEPCLMCVGACIQARVARIVFGCREPKSGALGSLYDVRPERTVVEGGVLAEPAAALLQEFFQARRGA